jgi:hypothetical protein
MTATVGGAVPTPPNNTTTFLRGDGTFATPTAGGLTVGTTTITSGTTTRILYNNAGVLGEYTLTGTGTVAVMQNTPTLTTPVINGTITGTGQATAATASTIVMRDTNGNLSAVNSLEGYSTTATAAGTTVLTVASNSMQYFTGVTTQTVTLPVTSTLVLGQSYWIINNSTGLVTVNSSGANAVIVLAAATSVEVTCILTSGTTAASWSAQYFGANAATGKKLTINNTITLSGTDGTTMTFPSTSATIARTDAENTFTGVQTMTSPALTTPAITGLATGSGVASTATASTLVSRDTNINTFANDFLVNATSTATAGATTTLTVASSPSQIFTGASAQTLALPDATTLTVGKRYWVNNNSSGSITVKDNATTTLYTVPGGGFVQINLLVNGTAAGSWDFHPLAPGTVTWGSGTTGLVFNTALTTTPSIAAGVSSATAPSFIPQRGASTTGFGGDGTNLQAIIAGATSTTFNSTGLTVSTTGVITTGTIELGAATDNTLARVAAGITSVEGEVINGFGTTTTAAGTTTLTITAGKIQYFTGSSTQTVKLPTTSVVVGQSYIIKNLSTGSVTVQSSGANTIVVLGAGMSATFVAQVATPTTAANWDFLQVPYQGMNLATTASANAATANIAYVTNTITNNSAATITITMPTAGAVDGEIRVVRVLDFSAVAQTLTWVNTENSTATAPVLTNGSTTLPISACFQYNGASSKWRCIASA